MDAFSNTPQYFYHTSVSSAIAIKLLNWCLSGASPEQETVLWNISFEVLTYPLSLDLAGAQDKRGEVSRGSNACADCLAGFASWEVLPTLVYLSLAGPFARAKGVDRVVFHSGVTQPLCGCSGAGSRAVPASQSWKHRVQSSNLLGCFLFTQEKFPWLHSVVLVSVGCPCSPGSRWDVWQTDGGQGHPVLPAVSPPGWRRVTALGKGLRAEPWSLPWTDLIFQSHLPRCPWALTQGTQSCLKTEKYLWGP